jgi:imidazolonepropionase
MVDGDIAFGLIENAAIGISEGNIVWLGRVDAIPGDAFEACPEKFDCEGQLVTPGFIDCHTHLIYAGNRAKEFELRLKGTSYQDIAREGGGIVSTVLATRNATADELYQQALPRLQGILGEGVTTIEIKSGYGLSVEDELKMLRVARRLGATLPAKVVTSFLGAHALPPEYAGRDEAYIDLVCEQILPAVAKDNLADAVDAFCEGIAFTPRQVNRVFKAAQELDLPIKLHAEQLSDLKGAVLAAKLGALSVDHLEFLNEEDVPVIAEHRTVAVLLPGAFYFLRETQLPPVDALRSHNVPIAIASDSNPGSSPVGSLLLMLNMACTLFNLTPEEALSGVTRNAAQALGLADRIGTLEVDKCADMVLWQANEPVELSYRIGGNPCKRIMQRGISR